MALTAKQQMFVKEYLVDLNATQAAIRAGYSVKTADRIGPELLGKTWVAEAIQAGMDARSQRTEITADYVLDTIRKTIERCQSAEEYQPAAVLKGAELLGKHLKLFTDKLEHSGGVTVNVNKP